MFEKRFKTFEEGIKDLMGVSHSAASAIMHNARVYEGETDAMDEADTAALLTINVISDRPTGNGIGWGSCKINVSADGVRYTTTGGLVFGWEHYPKYTYSMNPEPMEVRYRFFVQHPSGDAAPVNSTLRAAALAAGWDETCKPVEVPVTQDEYED